MPKLISAALSLAMIAMTGGTALAANGSMSASDMTPSEKTQMQKCEAMGNSAMMNDEDCAALMKQYPDAMNQNGGSNGSGTMNNGAGSGNGANDNGGATTGGGGATGSGGNGG